MSKLFDEEAKRSDLKATDSVLTPSQTNMLAHVFPLAETL